MAKEKRSKTGDAIPFSKKDRLIELGIICFFALLIYLFFHSLYAFVLLPPAVYFFHKYYRKIQAQKYRETLNTQFKDALLSLTAALRAGYSMENAIGEAYQEMQNMYTEEAPICRELMMMLRQMSIGVPVEEVFRTFAERAKTEEIETFSAVFAIAKRTGGDMVEILLKTATDIAARIDTQNEIAIVIHAKKFEQNLMALMPPLMILYLDLTTGSMLAPLYETLVGRFVMVAALGVYIGAYFLSRRLMKIEV